VRELTDRNRHIIAMVEAGNSYSEAARPFGLSRMRVFQIYHRHLARVAASVKIVPNGRALDIPTA
jgi:DNA-binding CsgD family transcriptional regulator